MISDTKLFIPRRSIALRCCGGPLKCKLCCARTRLARSNDSQTTFSLRSLGHDGRNLRNIQASHILFIDSHCEKRVTKPLVSETNIQTSKQATNIISHSNTYQACRLETAPLAMGWTHEVPIRPYQYHCVGSQE